MPEPSRRPRAHGLFGLSVTHQVLWVLLLGMGLRLLLVTLASPTEWYEDGIIARNLARGLGFSLSPGIPTTIKAPVYPSVLAMIRYIFSDERTFLFAVGYTHVLLFACSYFFVMRIAWVFCSESIPLIVAIVYALHPSYVYYVRVVEATHIFLVAFPAALFFLLRLPTRSRVADFVYCGTWIGIAILTNPVCVVAILLAVLYLIIACPGYRRFRSGCVGIGILSVGIVLAPWMVRNALVTGEFIPLGKTPLYYTMYVGFVSEQVGSGSEAPMVDLTDLDTMMNDGRDREVEEILRPVVVSRILRNPGEYARDCARRAFQYWWVPQKYAGNSSWAFRLGRKLPVLLLLLGTVAGLVLLRKERGLFMPVAMLNLLAFTAVYSATFVGNIRFKLDVEWIQLFPTAYAVMAVYNKLSGVRSEQR